MINAQRLLAEKLCTSSEKDAVKALTADFDITVLEAINIITLAKLGHIELAMETIASLVPRTKDKRK